MSMARRLCTYEDPLDRIWSSAAASLGLQIKRGKHAYASTDGRGTLTIAPDEDLDADDCLGQIILHEICHWLVQGEDSLRKADWGLGNDDRAQGYAGDTGREHGCLVTQAALLRPYGLRLLLAPTTDFRTYYDALPQDPLRAADKDAVGLAVRALGLRRRPPFARILDDALRQTAAVHRLLAEVRGYDGGSLWEAAPAPALHGSGWPLSDGMTGPQQGTCGTCAWRYEAQGTSRCRRTGEDRMGQARVQPDWPACVLFEEGLDCRRCGACCRKGSTWCRWAAATRRCRGTQRCWKGRATRCDCAASTRAGAARRSGRQTDCLAARSTRTAPTPAATSPPVAGTA